MVSRSQNLRERRKDRRFALQGTVRLVVRGPGAGTLVGALRDVGAGGVCSEGSAHPVLPPGTSVDVAIDLKSDGVQHGSGMVSLRGVGEIVRIEPGEAAGFVSTAVRFTQPLGMREPLESVFLL